MRRHFVALRNSVGIGHSGHRVRRIAFPVTATTDFLAADILNKCGRAFPASIPPIQRTREPASGYHVTAHAARAGRGRGCRYVDAMAVHGTARQLHLFKGKRKRGTLPPAPTEFASQAALVDLIRRTISPAWRFTHMPLGEYRDPITAARLKRARRGRRLARSAVCRTRPGKWRFSN